MKKQLAKHTGTWVTLALLLMAASTALAGVDSDWTLTGNAGTTPGTNFLGTTDNKALEVNVNNTRALRIEPNATSPNIIGGFKKNAVGVGIYGATIGGGGYAGQINQVPGIYGTVGGGAGNTAGGLEGTVAGGYRNSASGSRSTVGGGLLNSTIGAYGFAGGGSYNIVSGDYSTISGGGPSNPADPTNTNNRTTDNYCTIGGGCNNQAGNGDGNVANADMATVAGGDHCTASGKYATIGGGSTNTAAGQASFVGGGLGNSTPGAYAAVAGGMGNVTAGECAAIGGGWRNLAPGKYSTVAGGGPADPISNPDTTRNLATADYCTVGGGGGNVAGNDNLDRTDATFATVAGGSYNEASGYAATVAGGSYNIATDTQCTVGGGFQNRAGDGDANNESVTDATVCGGSSNVASNTGATVGGGLSNIASGSYAFIGGGVSNTASGEQSMVVGGSQCTASGQQSFAAGTRAKAQANGVFAWADASVDADFTISDANRFGVRADGGVYLYSRWDLGTGVYLAQGSGSWSSLSDRNAKEGIEPVDSADVLEKLAEIPVATWRYKGEDAKIRHMGPMAQDLYAAFALGDSDKAIPVVDADGVALASVQALHQRAKEQDARIKDLESQVQTLRALVEKLAAR